MATPYRVVRRNESLNVNEYVLVEGDGPIGSVEYLQVNGVAGPKGDQGDAGPPGIPGIQGVQGDVGPQGIQGVQGDVGPQGIQGVQGDAGIQGPQGIQGDAGPQGIQGDVGPQGIQGIQGVQGEIGPTGVVDPDAVQTLTNKSLQDSTTYVIDNTDTTKRLQFQVSGITTATTRVATVPDQDGTMVLTTTTNRIHGSVPSWNTTALAYEDGQPLWADLIGEFSQRTAGGGATPFTLYQYDVNGRVYEYATTDGGGQVSHAYLTYHWPHDYVPGTDTFFHLHLSATASITTTAVFEVWAGSGKRDGTFPELTQLKNVAYTFAGAGDVRRHLVVEVPLSSTAGTGGTIANSTIETDGILQVYVKYTRGATVIGGDGVSNTDNMGNGSRTFVLFADVHYLSSGRGTKNKAAPFNT